MRRRTTRNDGSIAFERPCAVAPGAHVKTKSRGTTVRADLPFDVTPHG